MVDESVTKEDRYIQRKESIAKIKKSKNTKPIVIFSPGDDILKEYKIIEPLDTISGEADLYRVAKEKIFFILKLYRFGYAPKKEIYKKIEKLYTATPDNFLHIIQYGFIDAFKRYYEIQEYISLDLREFLEKNKKIEPDIAKNILDKLTQVIYALHQEGIIHRDIKPSNILIRNTNPLSLVLTDFAISSLLDPELSKKITSIRRSVMYSSPESRTGIIGKELDYWTLGIIMLEIMTGKHPYNGLNEEMVDYYLSIKPVPIPKDINPEWGRLIKGLLTRNPEKRWGYTQIISWQKGEKNIPVYFEETKEI